MRSLLSYFSTGLGLLITALAITLLAFAVMRAVPGFADKLKQKNTLKLFVVIWYCVSLELVSLCKNPDFLAAAPSIHVYNFHAFSWIGRCITDGWEALWQILLNFAAYVPLGFILADANKNRSRPYLRVLLQLVLVSVFNETVQYICAIGIADIDDLLANTFGGLWGLSIYVLWQSLRRRKAVYKPAIAAALPVVAACAAFAVYALRPYGYIKEDFNTGRLRARSVDCSAIEAQLPRQFTVYKILTLDRDAQIQRCQAVFDALHEEINYSTYDPYDTVIVYRGTVQSYYIWCWDSGYFSFHAMGRGVELDASDSAPDQRMRELLLDIGISIPAASEYSTVRYNNFDEHTMKYDFVESDGYSYCGSVIWKTKDDTLYELIYEVNALQAAGLKPGNASDNIAQNLSHGRMSSGDLFSGTVDELVCLKCEIQYNIDSKGFYRPVYLIECTADGKPAEIKTPAI